MSDSVNCQTVVSDNVKECFVCFEGKHRRMRGLTATWKGIFLTGLFVDSLVQGNWNGSPVGRWLLVFMRGSSSISCSLRAIQFCHYPICTFFKTITCPHQNSEISSTAEAIYSLGGLLDLVNTFIYLWVEYTVLNLAENPLLSTTVKQIPLTPIHCEKEIPIFSNS